MLDFAELSENLVVGDEGVCLTEQVKIIAACHSSLGERLIHQAAEGGDIHAFEPFRTAEQARATAKSATVAGVVDRREVFFAGSRGNLDRLRQQVDRQRLEC